MDISEVLGKLGFNSSVFIFNLLNFAIIAALLWRFFFAKMIKTIETRQAEIEKGLQTAEMAKTEIAMATQKGEEIIREAKKEANEIVREGVEAAKSAASRVRAEAELELERLRQKSEAEIAAMREKMLKEFKLQASDLVILATRKLLREKNSTSTDNKEAERVISGLNLK